MRWIESILMVIMAAPFALDCVAKLMDAAAAALARGDRGDARAGASAVAAVMPDSASPPNRFNDEASLLRVKRQVAEAAPRPFQRAVVVLAELAAHSN